LRITISVGVAAFPEDARDPIELVELADTALYRAKNLGRNQVVAYCVSPPGLKPGGSHPGEPR
jgi:diguanylate cyclase (GGDEF)-like protein